MHKILLIDDDEALAAPLTEYLLRFDFELVSKIHPHDGLARLESNDIDAVILDVMLPDMDGFEVCREIRKTSAVPIIMLTARGDVMDRVVGLEIGADDYLPKPFEPRELAARLQNIVKRSSADNGKDDTILRFEGLEIDTQRRNVILQGQVLKLTGNEYELLLMFAKDPGKKFHRDEILNQLRGIDLDILTRAVDILVSRLRNKLKPLECIETIRGVGYTFNGVRQ
ncbi:response regulator transcription factor [Beggiatoa alba]|nr:response regulator transcription factor [bacterium AH-315-E07]MBN4082019.1 response regulator transcription factor [Beggiatoa alba]